MDARIHTDPAPELRPRRAERPPLASSRFSGARGGEVARTVERVLEGRRIDGEEALLLHRHADLPTLMRLADEVRRRLHPEPVVTYVVDRNLNPTNVCVVDCGFCAFYRSPKDPEGYVLEREELLERVRELDELGGRQLLMQGGHHPRIGTEWWCELIAEIGRRFPRINCHALSAPELDHLTKVDRRPIEEVIAQLKDAGWGSLPGAGAEILVERVRRIIAPRKTDTDRWLDIHRKVHEAGLRSSATMMYGNVETDVERIEHLQRLRDLQDETGGFTAFACWNTQPEGVPEEHLCPRRSTPALYVRMQSLARIFLDNVENMQTSYVTQGLKLAQVSLRFGCNDFGGTMLEENVVSAAGCFHLEPIQEIERVIEAAGFVPRRRNSWYGIVDERHEGETFPSCAAEAHPPKRVGALS